ncbi:hypothetical protein [Vampirovibrio sp.]|uniref:hypothetical protein n=1 Tax=Vampirovibrio sp. TaxID=2717857 RepID=UPI003593E502
MPALEWRWALFGLILLLIFAAVMAGWFNMVAQACVRFLSVPKTEALKQNHVKDSLVLFKEFFPGIGQYFGPVALAYSIHAGLLLAFGWVVRDLWAKNQALVIQMATLPLEQRESFIKNMTLSQQTSLAEFSFVILAGVGLYACFYLLTMLWPTYIIFYNKNGWQACLSSAAQFFRDPLRLISLTSIIGLIWVPLFLLGGLAGASNLLVGVVFQFLNLLAQVFFTVILFVYAYQFIGKPLPPVEADDPSEASAEKPPLP